MVENNQSLLVVDEIPGRIVGNDDEPPGRILHLNAQGDVVWDISSLKMPYDAVPTDDGCYLVNIIREKAVCKIAKNGAVLWRIEVGGYPCSLQLLSNGNFLVAGWDYHLPGFAREFDQQGNQIWRLENLGWPWKAERLKSGNTLVADAKHNRVFEVNQRGEEVWAIDNIGPKKPELFDHLGPVYCQRLESGSTLLSIRASSRVVEFNVAGQAVWEISPGLVSNQYSAVRLPNGNTLVADAGHHRVIELNQSSDIIWEKGGFGYPAKAYRL